MNKKDKSDKHEEVSLPIQNVLEYIPAWKVYLSKAILQQLQVGLVIYLVFRTDKVCTIYKRSYNNPLNIIHQRHKVVSSLTKCTLSIVSIKKVFCSSAFGRKAAEITNHYIRLGQIIWNSQ